MRQLADEDFSEEIMMRKVSRVLRVHFRRQREAAIGPDLSHRRTLVKGLLAAPSVQQAIAQEAASKKISHEKASERALKYADEVAADYSYSVVRAFEIVLNWLWTRLYDGVEVNHFEDIQRLSHDHEIIYVPCHRSHIDYLLLSFVIFRRGLMTPHIAAGANLNMPVVGPLLRRAGAFFLRRSFKGNFLYAAVFNEYIHLITAKGYSVEYFVEGGRSRTGRLLAARTGMLSMTLRSYLRDHKRPIVFIPAYIGYEKLMEGKTYVGELAGQPKQKETVWGLISSLRKIQKVFGQVHLNFGEPIYLSSLLDTANPAWRETPVDEEVKTPWITETISTLANQITTNINSAAAVNPINLLSFVLLSTTKHAMDEKALIRQLDLYRQLLIAVPYSNRIVVTPLSGAEIIAYGEKLKVLYRIKHPLGDLMGVNEEQAMLLTYFRNNVMHLFMLPSLIACLMQHNSELYRVQVEQLVRTIYPFMRSELFLPWSNESITQVITQWLEALTSNDLIIARDNEQLISPSPASAAHAELNVLAQGVRQSLQRYFMTVSLLTQQGSGCISRKQLEELCSLLAQRIAILHEFSAPEYFDKAVFRNFVETLIDSQVVQVDISGNLTFDVRLINIAAEARLVLDAETRQAIQQITHLNLQDIADIAQTKGAKEGEKAA
jgi:glycerol-3-phosphate O-acyltransferase